MVGVGKLAAGMASAIISTRTSKASRLQAAVMAAGMRLDDGVNMSKDEKA